MNVRHLKWEYFFDSAGWPRICKRRGILFQISLLIFLTWREYFNSKPTNFYSQPSKLGFKQSSSPFTKPLVRQYSILNLRKLATLRYQFKDFFWMKQIKTLKSHLLVNNFLTDYQSGWKDERFYLGVNKSWS